VGDILVSAPKYTRTRQSNMISLSRVCLIDFADSMSKKETTIRRKDFRGAQLWSSVCSSIRLRMLWRFSTRKMSGSSRLVMRRVFEGGEGVMRGGRSERSSNSGVLGVVGEDRRLEMVLVCSGGSIAGSKPILLNSRTAGSG